MTSYKTRYEQEVERNRRLQDKLIWALDQVQKSGQPVAANGEEDALRALHARKSQIRHGKTQRQKP